jgi:hypothetical protein
LIYERSKKSFNSKANAMLMDLRPHNSLLGSNVSDA